MNVLGFNPPGMGRGRSSITQSLPSIKEALIPTLALNTTQPGGTLSDPSAQEVRGRDQDKLPQFKAEPLFLLCVMWTDSVGCYVYYGVLNKPSTVASQSTYVC